MSRAATSPTGARRWAPTLRRRARVWAAREPALIAATIATLALYYVIPAPLLALPLLLAYAALAWLRLDIALATLPLSFPYWFVPKHIGGHAVLPLSEIALGVCLAVALGYELRHGWRLGGPRAWRCLARRLRAMLARLGWLLALGALLFVAGATLGLLVARRPPEALRAWRWEIVEPLLYLVLLLCYARGPRNMWRLVWALLGSAVLLAALATLQIAAWRVTFSPLAAGNRLIPLLPDSAGLLRATAFVYGSGNSLGAALERALPLALALALVPPRSGGVGRRARALALLVCLALLPALYWSGSRGAWVGAAIGVLVVICLTLGRPWLLVVLAALGGLLAVWQRNQLIALALAGHNATGQLRLLLWLAAWHMIRDHPLLGIGLDQFLYLYSNLYSSHPYWITVLNGHPTIAGTQPNLAHPHNLLLDLWLSIGVLGLAGFLIVLGVVWRRCWHIWRAARRIPASARQRPAAVGAVALGIGASLLAGIVHGMVDSAYFEPDLALLFWASVALLLLVSSRAGAPAPASDLVSDHQ
jgi:O-antigen ligase